MKTKSNRKTKILFRSIKPGTAFTCDEAKLNVVFIKLDLENEEKIFSKKFKVERNCVSLENGTLWSLNDYDVVKPLYNKYVLV